MEVLTRLTKGWAEPAPNQFIVEDLGFDSLQILTLVEELSDEFNIIIPADGMVKARTVADVLALAHECVAQQESWLLAKRTRSLVRRR